mgnify:CR=1 FL=1|tara:strand:+ start:322 stop:525 length:204 start_codon:yes stop_codon:yes gene_type:complete
MADDEVMTELNISSYYRDEMRDTLEKIKVLFNISLDNMPDDWNVDNDEHFGDYIYGSLQEYKKLNID